MIKEQVITTIITISRVGQRVYFQIKLPKDTNRIIGLEWGVMGLHTKEMLSTAKIAKPNVYFSVLSNYPVGRITLIAPGTANIIFQSDIIDYGNYHLYHEVTSPIWPPVPWSHFGKSEEFGFNVAGDVPIIEGNFIDGRSPDDYDGFEFDLHIYLWIEKYVP